MAKYYVQSGTVRTIVEAESSRKAALWAVHRTMQQILPTEAPVESGDEEQPRRLERLDRDLQVSAIGFGVDEVTLPTIEVVGEWNEMVTALERLERLLHETGIAA